MMIEEFRKLQMPESDPIKLRDFNLVEFIYTYHPLNLSKEAAASLYDEFGLMIFLDMLPRAKKAAKLETDMRIARVLYEDKKREYETLADVTEEDFDLTI